MGCIEPHHIYIGKPLGVSGWNTWPPRPVWRVPSGAKVTPGVGSVHVCSGNLDAVKYLRLIGRLWGRLPRCWRARDTVGTWPALGVLSEHPAFWRGFQLRQIQPLKECSCTKRIPFRYLFNEKLPLKGTSWNPVACAGKERRPKKGHPVARNAPEGHFRPKKRHSTGYSAETFQPSDVWSQIAHFQ